MSATGFIIFETPLGRCGVAWTAAGIARLQLPEVDDGRTIARLLRSWRGAQESPVPMAQPATESPPPAVQRAIAAIRSLLDGELADLTGIELDWTGVGAFDRRVYDVTRAISPGQTLTYGAVATRIGAPEAARAVGRSLGKNPFAIIVPCHRVLAAGGGMGGFSANGGVATKQRLLQIERSQFNFPAGGSQGSLFE